MLKWLSRLFRIRVTVHAHQRTVSRESEYRRKYLEFHDRLRREIAGFNVQKTSETGEAK
jgi:hypothetical protein